MALTSDLIDVAEMQAQFAALEGVDGHRLGKATFDKLSDALANCGASDPDLGSDFISLSETELAENFRVGLRSAQAFSEMLADAVANSAVHVP